MRMRVRDLIEYLQDLHPDDEIAGEWGVVKPSCTICGAAASLACWKDRRPVCEAHFTAFATEDEICFFNRY
jgi:hypothetical protein